MTVGTPYKRSSIDDRYDAIVIGSGIGGLTTAALLARHANKRVLVLEKHYTAGGFTHAFRRPGFEWDVGVHYVGDVLHPKAHARRIFDHITDGALAWADMGEVYDTIVLGDERFELRRGREALRDELVRRFPNERAAIDAYFALVKKAVKTTQLFFAEKAIPGPLAFAFGGLMRRPAMAFTRRTTREVLESLTSDQKLIAILTAQWCDYGLPPGESSFLIHATVVNHYLEGAAYPVGGAARIAETIAPLIEARGGQIVTSAEVTEILVEGGAAVGVRLPGDRVVLAPIVVSAAGVALTYGRLLPAEARARVGLGAAITSVPPSIAHLTLYVGLNRSAEALGFSKSNVWVLGGVDHDAAVREATANPEGPIRHAYLSFPSAKDPDFLRRHPGKATAEIITLIPYEAFAKWDGSRWGKRGEDYDAFKARLSEQLLEHLYREHPSARGHVVHAELSTPLTTKHFASHPSGEIYGLAHTPRRFEDRALKPATKIRGLYLSGADVCSAGVAGAMIGGVLSASAITKRNLLASALRGAQPEGPGTP
jgi:all-trans-retinol 13,14-reductase